MTRITFLQQANPNGWEELVQKFFERVKRVGLDTTEARQWLEEEIEVDDLQTMIVILYGSMEDKKALHDRAVANLKWLSEQIQKNN